MMERIVFLDAQTLPVAIPRLPWAHEWENYPLTMPQDVIQHAQAASVIITNSTERKRWIQKSCTLILPTGSRPL